jgi:hypothetical protein
VFVRFDSRPLCFLFVSSEVAAIVEEAVGFGRVGVIVEQVVVSALDHRDSALPFVLALVWIAPASSSEGDKAHTDASGKYEERLMSSEVAIRGKKMPKTGESPNKRLKSGSL